MAAQQPPVLANNQRLSIEFVVKPTEDLFLEGSLRRLPRVTRGEAYPCQMQKTQAFSCLFRHYAKHNGLRKEDLVFSFVDELLPDQTPESVHLMPSDEIFVSLRKPAPPAAESPAAAEKKYPKQFKSLLESGAHADVTFIVDEGKLCIRAHKAILSARSDYFDAMLREGGMSESFQSEISIDHDGDSFKRMLEYIYVDEISDIKDCDADEVLKILLTANQFVMDDLRVYVEPYAAKLLSVENIAKFMLLSADKETSILREACIEYIHDRKQELAADSVFYREVESNPELGLLLFKYAVNPAITNSSTPDDPQVKRRRCSERIMPILSASTANSTNTNTIAQSNASVQEL